MAISEFSAAIRHLHQRQHQDWEGGKEGERENGVSEVLDSKIMLMMIRILILKTHLL